MRRIFRFLHIAAILITALFAIACGKGPSSKEPPLAKNGVLDLRGWDFEKDGIIALKGEWSFVWGRFVAPDEPMAGTAPVPAFFGDKRIDKPGRGHATYRLKILTDPSTPDLELQTSGVYSSHRLFINERPMFTAGKIGTSSEASSLAFPLGRARLKGGEHIITLHVSNYHHRTGGIRGPIRLGTAAAQDERIRKWLVVNLFISGSMFLMGLYQLAVFGLVRRGRASIYFSIACFLIGSRALFGGHVVPDLFLGGIDGLLELRLAYLTNIGVVAVLIAFARNLFPNEIHRWVTRITFFFYVPILLLCAFAPPIVFTHTLIVHRPLSSVLALYVVIAVIVATIRRREGAFLMLGGVVAVSLAGMNDNLYYAGIIRTGEFLRWGMLALIFSQAMLLALRYANSLSRSRELARDLAENNEELRETNAAVSRFVPRDFLHHLGRDRILDVKLGDQIEREMTILFSDIRDFTTLSESMSPQENFNFINSYLKRMEPLIAENDGFIDKYIGDAVMALFAGEREGSQASGADAALKSSLAMLAALVPYNEARVARDYLPVRIGIGLNTGRLMLGTVGGANRMDGTVISDAVNLAARVEGMSKMYGAELLITESTRNELADPGEYLMRPADRVIVKGKSAPVTVFEVFQGDEPRRRDLKSATLADFRGAYELYLKGDFGPAGEGFRAVLERNPDDVCAAKYVQRTAHFFEKGKPENWDGVFVLEAK